MESFKAMNPLAFRINDIVVWTGKAWGNPRAGVKVRSNPIGGPLNSSYNGAVLFLLYKNRTRENNFFQTKLKGSLIHIRPHPKIFKFLTVVRGSG
jgi:hypothetical protein